MDEKALKRAIKQLVKESLTEIFAEMKLESIVESAVARKIPKAPVAAPVASTKQTPAYSMREVLREEATPQPRPTKPTISAAEKKRLIAEKLGVKDDMWANIYADTQSSGNPILESSDDDAPPVVGEVPEVVLENMGLMRDYSKHIGVKTPSQQTEDDDMQARREARLKMMNEKVSRGS